jgi:hypothetical protein
MESPVHDADGSPEPEPDHAADRLFSAESSWLGEIVDQLERNPQECWQAIETLETLEPELRLTIIHELAALAGRPGAGTLLRLLSASNDPATRGAAISALEQVERAADELLRIAPVPVPAINSARDTGTRDWGADVVGRIGDPSHSGDLSVYADTEDERPRLVRSLVTPVDGEGRGLVAVSVRRNGERFTAVFHCDVRLGIRDVSGQAERESPRAGGLIDAFDMHPDGDSARDVPEFALRLLAGSLMLCGPDVPPSVRNWLLRTFGPTFHPASFPPTIPGLEASSISPSEMPIRVAAVLDACPTWLDSSPLTFELAEEIWLREGRTTADPERDRGAYRFLFEHRLIQCLELYQRMLLWMAWLWKSLDEIELSRSALALASQLLDEQYAVPSHPFTVELTTRSLEAAQRRLRTAADPRTNRST